MNTLILTKNKKASKGPMAAFNRRLTAINKLNEELTSLKEDFEEALGLYHSHVKPLEKKAGKAAVDFLLKLIDITQNFKTKALNKGEHKQLREIATEATELIFSFMEPAAIPEQIHELYKDINGTSYDDEFKGYLDGFKEEIKKQFGVDMDFSQFTSKDTMEDMLSKFASSASEYREKIDAHNESRQESLKKKKDTKKTKLQQSIELKDSTIDSLYKKLAKILHPDLEQDPVARGKKEEMMKQVTTANKNKDLLSLLTIDAHCREGNQNSLESAAQETIKIYNDILKDQAEDIKVQIATLSYDPRYMVLQKYIDKDDVNPLQALENAFEERNEIIEEYEVKLEDISGTDGIKTLKSRLAMLNSFSDNDFELIKILSNLANGKVRM